MTFNRKDFIGLAALLVGLSLGANLTASQERARQETSRNQQDFGQPFLQQLVPLELQAHTEVPTMEQAPGPEPAPTLLVQIRKLSQVKQ